MLSAIAQSVLAYAMAHQVDGVAELGDDIGFPEESVITACKELKSCGKIRDFGCSDGYVEFIVLSKR